MWPRGFWEWVLVLFVGGHREHLSADPDRHNPVEHLQVRVVAPPLERALVCYDRP